MSVQVTDPGKKLGVLIPGLGAVGTTVIAGTELVRRGYSKPMGSLTQMGTVRLGKRTENRSPMIKDFVPLVNIEDIVFGGWDILEDSVYDAAIEANVLSEKDRDLVRDYLSEITPMKAVYDPHYVKKLSGNHVKEAGSKYDLAQMLMDDIDNFASINKVDSLVMVWCGSTEIYMEEQSVHQSLESFEEGLRSNHPAISPSMIYAYAALKKGIPFANGAPNLTIDFPAMIELAKMNHVPIAGKDFKTGQTLMKTIVSPGLKARLLGVKGWFSTNILGNRDGEVLDDPESLKTKEISKLGVLDYILQPHLYPDLYDDIYHKVRINYYPPTGDNKEGWDNIDLFGWLGYPMQLKIDFLCRDSILAAPIVLDLALFLDLSRRSMLEGIQEWLSFYFKSPMVPEELYPEHDLFIQLKKLKNTLRWMMGEDLITHLGREYYDE